ncbi:Hypothetical predicted protein [Olea europaea subsp. europaea]|uniref:Uncharacterized protein n=1 Tax=Olea europaea subsp. europaea TaxID=158383 RepID=A0A8S0Q3H0_OLEEU|nr:Hypothetical predicted protein [Olea europaea subsp. europaea]
MEELLLPLSFPCLLSKSSAMEELLRPALVEWRMSSITAASPTNVAVNGSIAMILFIDAAIRSSFVTANAATVCAWVWCVCSGDGGGMRCGGYCSWFFFWLLDAVQAVAA